MKGIVEMGAMGSAVDRTVRFARNVELEMKRITWPSFRETVRSTLAVIAISVILAAFLGVVDLGFSFVVKLVLE